MKLKTIEIEGKTYAEVSDGKPLFTGDDGKDIAFDAPGTVATISRLNGEAKGHREAKEKAENALKTFEGIDDPKKALEALNTVANLDAKKLIDAGEVDKVKAEITKAFDEKLSAESKRADDAVSALNKEMIGGSFSRSKFIAEKLAFPADVAEAMFGKSFSIQDGKIVAKFANGNDVFSKSSPGELAAFEEAIELLVDAYPNKDSILKGSGNRGGGTPPNPGGPGGSKTKSLDDFNKLGPKERAAFMADGGTIAG